MKITLGVVRGISYGVFGPPDTFVPQARSLGATLVRAYVYWAQVEPSPGHYDWSAVDALLDQLGGTAAWLTVCSSSRWGTRVPTDFQPPSPALDDSAYERFVGALVRRCAGRIRYWQANNEPSNTGLLWSGTAGEYVHQLELFARAVRTADPSARVVLGGCGYDVLASPPGSPQRDFFDELARSGRDAFDLFSVHLYDDPHRVPEHLETARGIMRAHGYERPLVAGEHNGPTLFDFPAATAELERSMAAAFAAPDGAPVRMSTEELAAQVSAETPDRRALRDLYARRAELPPELRLFLADEPAPTQALRDRIAGRQLAQRVLLALAGGVDTLVCWSLAPEVPDYADPYNVMDLMFGRLPLMDFAGGRIARVRPEGEAHRRLAGLLHGADRVDRIDVGDPDLFAFRIHCDSGPDRLAVWARGDVLAEGPSPRPVRLPWAAERATAVDVLGAARPVRCADGTVSLLADGTPVFVTAEVER